LVKIIPSIPLLQNYYILELNSFNYSIPVLPINASPTNNILSGLFSLINVTNSYINLELFYILPAVSIKQTSASFLIASIIPYLAILDGTLPYPYS